MLTADARTRSARLLVDMFTSYKALLRHRKFSCRDREVSVREGIAAQKRIEALGITPRDVMCVESMRQLAKQLWSSAWLMHCTTQGEKACQHLTTSAGNRLTRR